MAKVIANTRPVERVVVDKVKEFTLTLSEKEAETLYLVLGRVGGGPFDSRRQFTDAVHDALYAAGLRNPKNYADYFASPISGSVSFKSEAGL